MAGEVVQVVEHLSSKHEALRSNPSTTKEEKKVLPVLRFRSCWAECGYDFVLPEICPLGCWGKPPMEKMPNQRFSPKLPEELRGQAAVHTTNSKQYTLMDNQ
jgi:hypothetical protein